MSALDRLTRAALAAAARRWPGDLADQLRAEWHAEIDALHHDPSLGTLTRAYRILAFAGSLAISPAVDQPSWPERATGLGRAAAVAAGVTLLAAALFNAVHAAGGPGLLILAVLAMALLGRRMRTPVAGTVGLLGLALFAFLFIGNDGAVMPFMGFADVAPAVATWTVLTTATVRWAATARGGRRVAVLAGGGLAALHLAVIAGSWHAAGTLGLGLATAPAWFPLALLPGGTVEFGTYYAGGTAAFGPLQVSGPAFHASDILLANAAATAGPMLLCSVFVLALASRPPAAHPAAAPPAAGTPAAFPPAAAAGAVAHRRRILVGSLAALGGLALAEVLRHPAPAVDTILHRLVDNSAVFGFGFLAHPVGRAAVALLVALLTIRAVDAMVPARSR